MHRHSASAVPYRHPASDSPVERNGLLPGAEIEHRIVALTPVERCAVGFDQLVHHAPSQAIARKALRARGRELS